MATKLPDIKKVVDKLAVIVHKGNGQTANETQKTKEQSEAEKNEKAKKGA